MEKKAVWNETLYLLAYTLWLLCAVINITCWKEFDLVVYFCRYMQSFSYLLLVLRFFYYKSYTVKDILGIFLILYSVTLAEHSVYNSQIIPAAIFVCCSGNVRFDKVLKHTFFLQAVIMVITIAASQVGIIEDEIWQEVGRIRHGLGYKYCGYPAHIFLFMTLMWFCIRKQKRIIEAVGFLILNYLLYRLTDSRTDFYLAILGIAGFFLWSASYSSHLIRCGRDFIIKHMFIFIAASSIMIHIMYRADVAWMSRLNEVLNGRLQLGFNAVNEYGFSLFGKAVRWIGQGSLKNDPTLIYNYVDCAFLKEAISYGMIFLILLSIGYYLAGRKMIQKKEFALSWAVLVSLLYSVINAHLCVLTFNVFFLVQGSLFDTDSQQEYLQLSDAMVGAVSKWKYKIFKRKDHTWIPRIRKSLFFIMLSYMVLIQYNGVNAISKKAAFYQWTMCTLVFCIALLCCASAEKSTHALQTRRLWKSSKTAFLCSAFLFLACISDIVVNKRFQYAAFGMLIFGGIFVMCWSKMKNPETLFEEFQWTYKVWFIVLMSLSIVFRPAMGGICYSGLFTNASTLGIAALIAVVLFFHSGLAGRANVWDSIGGAAAIYLLWTTQQFDLIVIGVILIISYIIVFGKNIYSMKCCKNTWIYEVVFRVVICVGTVLILRMFLYYVSPKIGLNIVFANDNTEYIQTTIFQMLQNGKWDITLFDRVETVQTYLQQLNIFGHKYLPVLNGKKIWADNSFLMNVYRYGILTGVMYVIFLISFFYQAFYCSNRKKDFISFELAVVCGAIALTETIELPFAHIGWFVFYLMTAWLIVLENRAVGCCTDVKLKG